MSITGISSVLSGLQASRSSSSVIKKDFEDLGNALQSGDVSKAKEVFAKLQKDLPSQGSGGGNPLASDLEKLGKALTSGDLETARDIFSNIEARMSQGPGAGESGNKAQGRADAYIPSGSGDTGSAVYDVRDTNHDGVVSAIEEYEYALTHADEADKTSQDSTGVVGNTLDIKA